MYSPHFFRGEQSTAGFHIGDAIPDLPRSPNISSKSSSNLTAVNSSTFHLQFGGLANAVRIFSPSIVPFLDRRNFIR
ncbi:hypothetical protein FCM35_KLT02913 [Carex littledalei]|uniref:Uncharacterized protein n=1 Tax=Carex littledalei TaxID=544730 RepID=A0A833R3R8_9POAL|nr:hypothetical protein FCM35_KLT02913 [Carex littledalei]